MADDNSNGEFKSFKPPAPYKPVVKKTSGMLSRTSQPVIRKTVLQSPPRTVAPSVAGVPPSVAGVPPSVAGVPPSVAGVPPRVAGVAPRVAGVAPRVAGVAPRVAGVPPRVAGIPLVNPFELPNAPGVVAGVKPSVAGVPLVNPFELPNAPSVAGVKPSVASTNPFEDEDAEKEKPKEPLTLPSRRIPELPLPDDAPIMEPATFRENKKALTDKLIGSDPVKVKPALTTDGNVIPSTAVPSDKVKMPGFYVPRTSSQFQPFILQNFAQFSPYLEKFLRTGKLDDGPKEIDQDACRKRDPNKVETFYYQNFVRDYMSRGTPYRGLLCYHGLGTGKTCSSIAAAEALYWGGQKTIYVLTPATLSNNYRKDLGKCGFYPLRIKNEWSFLKLTSGAKPKMDPKYLFLTSQLGLPPELVVAQDGGWVPNPDAPSNWDDLSPEVQTAILKQQEIHLNHRFKFIHYNGIYPTTLSRLVEEGLEEGRSIFDNAVVIIDEVHNLVRTINGTEVYGKSITKFIKEVEPREPTWSASMIRETPGKKYPRGYSFYRLLQNAVGMKFIALSATPMINYAQELAVLINILGGEQRMVEISLKAMARDPATSNRIREWARKHPEIDFFEIGEGSDRKAVLNVTPVPFGFVKVVDKENDYSTRGFVRLPPAKIVTVDKSNERNLDLWALSLIKDLNIKGLLKAAPAEFAAAEVAVQKMRDPDEQRKIKGALVPTTSLFKLHTFPLLPEDPQEFVSTFVNRATLQILHPEVLKMRSLGLISYYRGGGEELMPRVGRKEIYEVPMSDYMFKEYAKIRIKELELEMQPKEEGKDEGAAAPKRKGLTLAEQDMYDQATKQVNMGFLSFSRAACNWVFPEEIKRPKLTQMQQEILSKDFRTKAGAADVAGVDAELIVDTEEDAPDIADEPTLSETVFATINAAMRELNERGDEFMNRSLAALSPKFKMMLDNIRKSEGPVLVYSNYKTLEGLGIFSGVLRFAEEGYLPLNITNENGYWEIPSALLESEVLDRPRYIVYSGDEIAEKRKLLLQLYNADLTNLPELLKSQCELLMGDDPDNRGGKICKVFMITQSGAEGISLFNTRQVHIMEPYWNNVRLQQVIGRAIRLCSHMNLPWEDRVVDIFTYLSVFTASQKLEGKGFMSIDKEKSTDEIIYNLAVKKQELADNLAKIMQSSAADCKIHFHEHGMATQCFEFNGRPTMHPDWHKDVTVDETFRVRSVPA